MYEDLFRPADDPWFSTDAMPRHVGTRQDFVKWVRTRLVRAVREGRQGVEAICPLLIRWISDSRMLRAAWDTLAAKGNTAPGPNRRRYADLDDAEVWELLGSMSRAIRNDTYRPGPEEHRAIPKDRGDLSRGCRTICLLNVEDRTVQRAVYDVLLPLLDPHFGRNILGFRPHRGRLHALALAERKMFGSGRYLVVAEDISNAFDRVPVQRLLDVLRKYVPSDDPLRLVRRLLDTGKNRGIRQGGPLSPLLLNLYLHHFLDEPWRRLFADVPMIRVADDILLLATSTRQMSKARTELERLLRSAGMPLKGNPVCDLGNGSTVDWLGFQIARSEEGLVLTIPTGRRKSPWGRLEERLLLAHDKPEAPLRANATINGWIDQMGPCFRSIDRSGVYRRIVRIAAKQGFDEVPTRNAIMARWRRAYDRWCDIRRQVKEQPEILDSRWPSPPSAVPEESEAGAVEPTVPWDRRDGSCPHRGNSGKVEGGSTAEVGRSRRRA